MDKGEVIKMNIVAVQGNNIMNWKQTNWAIGRADENGLGNATVKKAVDQLEQVGDNAKQTVLNGNATANAGAKNFELLRGQMINLKV